MVTIKHEFYDKSVITGRADLLCNCMPDSVIPRSAKEKLAKLVSTDPEDMEVYQQVF